MTSDWATTAVGRLRCRHVEQGAARDRAALERRPVAGLDRRGVRPEDVAEAEQATDARDVRLVELHLVVGHGTSPTRRQHRHGDVGHPAVPERADVLGDGAPGRALVDAHLGDPAVARHAGAEHRYAAGGEVLDRGVLARAAEREDDGVEGERRELRHDGLAVVAGLPDEQHAGGDGLEHLGQAVEHGDGERVAEGHAQAALDEDADRARPALAQRRRRAGWVR